MMMQIDGQLSIFDFLPKEQTHPGIAAMYRYYTERWNMWKIAQDECGNWALTHPVTDDRDFVKVYGDPRFWKFQSCYGCDITECNDICDRVRPAHFIVKEKVVRIENGVKIISRDFYCSECDTKLFHNGAMMRKVHICPVCKRRIREGNA